MTRTFRIREDEKHGRMILTDEGGRTMFSLQDLCSLFDADVNSVLPVLKNKTLTLDVPDRGQHIFIGQKDAFRVLDAINEQGKGNKYHDFWLRNFAFQFY